MSTLSTDTHPDIERLQIERLQIERLRQMPAWRKMALMAEMSQTVRTLALAGLRQRQPGTRRLNAPAFWPTCWCGREWNH